MNLLFPIPAENILETYNNINNILTGNDYLIFDAMKVVCNEIGKRFSIPANESEYLRKHEEIRQQLTFTNVLKGTETALRLMNELIRQINYKGGIPGIITTDLVEAITFKTIYPTVNITYTDDRILTAQWVVSVDSQPYKIFTDLYDESFEEIVPDYIVEYMHSAIMAYQQKMFSVSAALMSIIMEATLRDVLISKGYSFNPRVNSSNLYKYETGYLAVNGSDYIFNFPQAMPKSTSDFLDSTGGISHVPIKIKRIQNPDNNFELIIKNCDCIVDHLSSDQIEQVAKKRVNGLGEALNIARNKEKFLTPDILPEDFDDVIQTIRNKLVHLSQGSLETPLKSFDPSGSYTLRDFIGDPYPVFDLISNVPRFVNKQYRSLKS